MYIGATCGGVKPFHDLPPAPPPMNRTPPTNLLLLLLVALVLIIFAERRAGIWPDRVKFLTIFKNDNIKNKNKNKYELYI